MTYYISNDRLQLLCVRPDGEQYWTDDPFAKPVEFENRDDAERWEDSMGRIKGMHTCVVQSEPND